METVRSSDLSAKLLATENVSVVRAGVRTASFDIKSRVLTLPIWKDMTPEIEDMLIGHETGHALYTTDEYLEPLKELPKLHSYLNVIEDVRIEKLMKRRYPGLRKRMNEGYKQLNDRDFFGIKKLQSFDDLLLIDKINLYFKAGFQCGVKFTPEEKVFVNRTERAETVEEVIEIAKDVYSFSKQKSEELKRKMDEENPNPEIDDIDFDSIDEEDIDSDDLMDMDNADDSDDADDNNKNSKSLQKTNSGYESETGLDESELESKTEKAFSKMLEDLADDTTMYEYWELDNEYYESPIVSYKTILNETKSPEQWNEDSGYKRYYSDEMFADIIKNAEEKYNKFKQNSLKTVNYLVKEFEMKKSATLYKRATTSKIGSLDMSKVYSYKLKDDIFKRVTILPQGKNHGMLMLVDWSGSMVDVIQDTLEQVINLAMFCNKIQIPYRVLAFSDAYFRLHSVKREEHEKITEYINNKRITKKNILNNCSQFSLLELFSNKMSSVEFNAMSRRVLHSKFTQNNGYGMGSTPLNQALAWCYFNLGSYIKNNNIEKMTLITLTDGEGSSLCPASAHRSLRSVEYQEAKKIRIKNIIKEPTTQKTYNIDNRDLHTEVLLKMIKDKYNIPIIGFHICRKNRRDLHNFLRSNLPEFTGDYMSLFDKWNKDFKQQGFASIKNTGRDDLFLIPTTSTKIVEGDLSVEVGDNARSIARNFSKYLNVKRTSRVLLNRFVGLVA